MIVAAIHGMVSADEFIDFINQVLLYSKENHCFFLLISFEKVLFNMPLSGFHDLITAMWTAVESHDLKSQQFTKAIVGSLDQKRLHMYEMIVRNSSQHINLFYDFEEAKKWLRKAQSDYFIEKRWK